MSTDPAVGRAYVGGVFEPLVLRDEPTPALLVIVRLGANTLTDTHLGRSISECHERWGIWGFSVLEVPDGDYAQLARLRPIITQRRQLLVAKGHDVTDAGFPLLPTLDHPHWTVTLASPGTAAFERIRSLFDGPIANPAYRLA
jgi:hypothetical protein